MAKDKEKTLNPAAAQRKADKQKALKKGKAAVVAQRNERLANRNPDRLQAQIDELKASEAERGQLSQRDQVLLAGLERDVGRIHKAKAAYGGDTANRTSGTHESKDNSRRQILGKRGRYPGGDWRSPPSSDTDEDVRGIPMPKDTPPPVPHKRHGFQRRPAENSANAAVGHTSQADPVASTARITYESKPVIRDFRKEAVGFVPAVVKKKLDAVRGGPGQMLLEEDELVKLEAEGYGLAAPTGDSNSDHKEAAATTTQLAASQRHVGARHAQIEDVEDEGD